MLQILLQMHSEIPQSACWRLHDKQSFCFLRLGSTDWTIHPHHLKHTTWYSIDVYFPSDNASAKARPSSHFGLSQQDNFSNPERKANIVEVIGLAEGTSPIPGCHFLHVGAAIAWTRKHASKTRRVFSKLTDPKQDNPYKRKDGDL
jgi:hypothetical protein